MKATVTFSMDGETIVVESPSDDPQEIAGAVYRVFAGRVPGIPKVDVILGDRTGTVFVWDDLDKVAEGTVEFVE